MIPGVTIIFNSFRKKENVSQEVNKEGFFTQIKGESIPPHTLKLYFKKVSFKDLALSAFYRRRNINI